MFHGQPYCRSCGFQGPDFMWSYHHGIGMRLLLQDTKTKKLRTIPMPDEDEFFDHSKTEDELERVFEQRINATANSLATESEIRIEVPKLALADKNEPISLECPDCGSLLFWKSTGIS